MSRLTIELKSGVFAGNLGRRVRDKLWNKISQDWKANALMIFKTNTEQGYDAFSCGDTTREIVEYEGMILTAFEHDRKDQLALVAGDAYRNGYGPEPDQDGSEASDRGDIPPANIDFSVTGQENTGSQPSVESRSSELEEESIERVDPTFDERGQGELF